MSCNNCGSCSKGCAIQPCMDISTPLAYLENGDPNFCFKEISAGICGNLRNNKGIHPTSTSVHSSVSDLSALNNLATGTVHNKLLELSDCSLDGYKCLLNDMINWSWNVNKALICTLGGTSVAPTTIQTTVADTTKSVIWEGTRNLFEKSELLTTRTLLAFQELEFHMVVGGEMIVYRVSLALGLNGISTIEVTQRTCANDKYGIADGAIVTKNLSMSFDQNNTIVIEDFIWSVYGTKDEVLNTFQTATFCAFSDTINSKDYCDTMNLENSRTHMLLKVVGVV